MAIYIKNQSPAAGPCLRVDSAPPVRPTGARHESLHSYTARIHSSPGCSGRFLSEGTRMNLRAIRRLIGVAAFFLFSTDHSASLRAVVISEIYYHPALGEEDLEFIEIASDSAVPEDISGYSFTEGIFFEIPVGTILPPKGFLVICANATAFKDRYPNARAIGDYAGRLDADGERITLVNHARAIVQSVRYRDDGKWATAPDGTGHTLALRSTRLDTKEPESWTASFELRGTPGATNFSSGASTIDEVLIDRGDIWKYAKGTAAFSVPEEAWRAAGFDDSGWLEGPSGFGYDDGDDQTVLNDMLNGYISIACRKKFSITAEELAAPGEYILGVDFDDGFCAFLNAARAARQNCGEPNADLTALQPASAAREAGAEILYSIAKNLLKPGENILAISGHNFTIGSTDFSLIPRLIRRRTLSTTSEAIFFSELYRSEPAGTGWVELHNPSEVRINLGGLRLTDDAERVDPYIFPAGAGIDGGGYLVISEAESGVNFAVPNVRVFILRPDGTVAAATVFDAGPPAGVAPGSFSEARLLETGTASWVTTTPTAGAANQVARVADIVINEIFYHPPEDPPPLPGQLPVRRSEFIELYNRGTDAVDLSGFRFDRGVDYEFGPGATIPGHGYLVIAEDPEVLKTTHGFDGALGPYVGRLANDGENVRLVDRLGNPVDEVRYEEGGAWNRWADGGGASLELIDPSQENDVGAAWDASDDTSKAPWEKKTIAVTNYAVAPESDLHIWLVERGVCHIDDISVTRAGGTNFIPNPGFETSTAPWRLQGTHIYSRRITSDFQSGAASLELIASGKGDTLRNRIEIDTNPRLTAGPLDISLWTRWQRGGNLLVVHGEFTAGSFSIHPSPATNISGNTISAGLHLTIPLNLGTPGEENSARRLLRERTGSDNLGPTISDVRHRPVSPGPGQAVRVSARIADSGGVAEARVHFREGNGAGAFTQALLLDDGLSDDGAAGDGLFGGEIPGGANLARFVFYVEARDVQGAVRLYPLDAPAHTCLYQVQGPVPAGGLDAARVILDTARSAELTSRLLHSNDLLPGTFVLNDEDVYYNVGVRYRGSPWGRPARSNYRVRFEEDRRFFRGRKAINLDNSGGSPNEGAAYFLCGRAASSEKPVPSPEYGYIRTWFNGQNVGNHGFLQAVDRDFVTDWYGDAERALLFKVEGRRVLTEDGNSIYTWDGMTFRYRLENKENYRSYLIPGIRRSVDDWSRIIKLTEIMDPAKTPVAAFDATIESVFDVEQFLRVDAPRNLFADWDAFTIGNGHNGYLVLDPNDDRWELIPFDMDNTFGSTAVNLFPTFDVAVGRLMGRPAMRRLYFRILQELTDGYWNVANAGPYLDALQAAAGVSMAGIKSHITTTRATAVNAIRAATIVAFKIVTNSGNDIQVVNPTIQLEGDAPVQAATILFQNGSAEGEVLNPVWTTQTRWRATFALAEGLNELKFFGFTSKGDLVGSATIRVTYSSTVAPLEVIDWTPRLGSEDGGTVVTLQGKGFATGMRVRFGGVEAAQVTVRSPQTAEARTPKAPAGLPADGLVDIEVILPPSAPVVKPKGFGYITGGKFIRGDADGSTVINLTDPIALLFYLFAGERTFVPCADAADFDDNGLLGITDSLLALDYLFRGGPQPAAPFPELGRDTTDDSFQCQ